MIPQQFPGESNLAYHKRLIDGKLTDRTLADTDYAELAMPLYGRQLSSDTVRKMMYGSKLTMELLEADACRGFGNEQASVVSPAPSETDGGEHGAQQCSPSLALDEKINLLQSERYKLSAMKLELQRAQRQDSRFALFYEQLRSEMHRLSPPDFSDAEPAHILGEDHEYVLAIGDIHYGAVFESMHNNYSRAECVRRFKNLLTFLKKECAEQNIGKLTIVNVADSIQGILRISDVNLNDISVVDSVIEISRIIAEFLNQLSAVCEVEYYHVPAANHSQTRPIGSKANELASEDLEKIIVNWIRDLLQPNCRVNVVDTAGKDFVEFDVAGYSCIAMHGHQIRDIDSCVEQLTTQHRKMFDYVFLGHRHAANEQIVAEGLRHNIEVFTCPSFVGSDPYSDRIMRGSKAMAKLFEFTPKNGHVGSKNIILN